MYKGILLTLISLLPSPMIAEQFLVACDQPHLSGLYKQCQEVIFIESAGDRYRVYSKAEKKVLSLKKDQLFQALRGSEKISFTESQNISIPGSILWNNTAEEFQSLCKVDAEKTGALLSVSCGRHRGELIQKSQIFVLSPFQNINTASADFRR